MTIQPIHAAFLQPLVEVFRIMRLTFERFAVTAERWEPALC